jgi:hypothetical protein
MDEFRESPLKPGSSRFRGIWKKSLQICGAGRESRKWPMLAVGRKPDGKSRMNVLFAVKLFKIAALLIALTWIGSFIGDLLYSKRRRTTDKKQRKRLRWLEIIFDFPLHEFHVFGRKTDASKSLLDWQIEVIEPDIYLKRRNWISFLFILSALLWFGAFLFLFVYLLPWQKLFTHFQWVLFVLFAAFTIFPSLLIMLLCWLIRPYTVSKIQFKMNSQETVKTYLGIFKRTIPDLPSKLQIGGGGTRPVWAALAYANKHNRIPLFTTDRDAVNASEQAKALGLKETAEILALFKLEIEFTP